MRGLLLLIVVSGCVDTATTACPGSETVCREGTVCLQLAADNELCVRPDQFPPCDGVDEGKECSLAGDVAGTCYGGACLPAECGNKRIDAFEACDDGENKPGDGCSADCLSTEICGNGTVDPVILAGGMLIANEQCDDGNLVGHDGCSSGCVTETIRWTQILDEDPPPRGPAAMAYDAARNRLVMFGGGFARPRGGDPTALGDSWAWTDGWSRVPVTIPPQQRHGHAMAYDPKHKQVVLFGGKGTNELRDTWILEGDRWREITTTTKPPARTRHAMAYHPALGVVVYGGIGSVGTLELDDTFGWDGSAWQPLFVSGPKPSGRTDAAMAYDPARNVILLHGGSSGPGETWELKATGWTLKTSTGPRIRGASLGFDPSGGGMILFGGIDPSNGQALDDTWRWNGTSWAQLAPIVKPPVRYAAAIGNDSATGELVLFGGYATTSGCLECPEPTLDDTWRWTGTTWTFLARTSPDPVLGHAGVLDLQRGRIVRHGGFDAGGLNVETWNHDGARWRLSYGGPALYEAAMTYDAARGNAVLFGGSNNITNLAETWTTDGMTWTRRSPATSPPPRAWHAMAYDAARGRVVLFGGLNGDRLGDTWEWDGTTWADRTPAIVPGMMQPTARHSAAIAYDPMRQRVILFGGFGDPGHLDDMWEWNGSLWTRLLPVQSPSPRQGAAMAWDGARGKLVLFGGGAPSGNDAWEWDGTTWTFISVPSSPPARNQHEMVTSPAGAGVIVYGGIEPTELNDLWQLRYESDDIYQSCRGALDDDGDGLSGCMDQDCWASCTPGCPPGTSCPTNQPRCGDGVCNRDLESCRTCADCTCLARCGDWSCDPGETMCPGDCGP